MEVLFQGFYMAGPLGQYSPKQDKTFAAFWLGKPGYDVEREMERAHAVYSSQQEFVGKKVPFRIFLRAFPEMSGNAGTALQNSFMLCSSTKPEMFTDLAPTRHSIAHEMMHMFVGSIGDTNVPWYLEGLTEFYTHLLLLRSGHITASQYLDGINRTARGYYESPHWNSADAKLARLGFSEGVGAGRRERTCPTTAAGSTSPWWTLESAAVSGGKATLDDVILPLWKKRDNGEKFDIDTLIGAFEKEYGRFARVEHEAVNVKGNPFDPPDDTFGIGFERRAKKYKVNDLEIDGYESIRDRSVTDEQVRQAVLSRKAPADKK